MGSDTEPDPYSIPRLPLFSMTPHLPESSGTATPPLQTTASVPFQWEEQPGKPRPCTDIIVASTPPNKRLDLPPRLTMTDSFKASSRSPTTVLDGPGDLGGKPLFSSSSIRDSFRFPKRRRCRERRQRSFDSNCSSGWSPSWLPGEQQQLLLRGGEFESGGLFGSFRLMGNAHDKQNGEILISPLMTSSNDAGFVEERKKMRRNSSVSKVTGSHFWAKIYEGFKRVVVPWRKKPKMESFVL